MTKLQHSSLLAVFGVFGFGCTQIVDAGRPQCSTDADCTSRGSAFANSSCVENECRAIDAWSCAKHSPVVAKSSALVGVEFSLFDAITRDPVDGLTASLCGKLDVECASPLSQTQPDGTGTVHFDITPLFDGYVQLTKDKYDPTLLFLPPTVESVALGAFPLTSVAATQGLAATLGKGVMPGTGRVLVTTTGCDMQPTGGVTLEGENMGDGSVRFYSIGGLPTFTASSTDESGFAGFFNVEPGTVTVSAALESNGLSTGKVGLLVRPDHISVRRIQPWTD